MTIKQLVSAVARLEGKKHEASVGDIREILSILVSLEAAGKGVAKSLIRAASRRKKK